MALESVNNMHVLTIAEKDERIRELTELLEKGGGANGGAMSQETEEHYIAVLKENGDLRNQIAQMAE